MKRALIILVALPMLGGCVSTVGSVVTAPFKVAGKAADWATTSQDESDRNYGRKMRKQEAREGKELRKRQKQQEREARERRDD
jgi:hypothetical protein